MARRFAEVKSFFQDSVSPQHHPHTHVMVPQREMVVGRVEPAIHGTHSMHLVCSCTNTTKYSWLTRQSLTRTAHYNNAKYKLQCPRVHYINYYYSHYLHTIVFFNLHCMDIVFVYKNIKEINKLINQGVISIVYYNL